MTARFREPEPREETEREDPADRAERLYESERDARAVAETLAEDAAVQRCRYDQQAGGAA